MDKKMNWGSKALHLVLALALALGGGIVLAVMPSPDAGEASWIPAIATASATEPDVKLVVELEEECEPLDCCDTPEEPCDYAEGVLGTVFTVSTCGFEGETSGRVPVGNPANNYKDAWTINNMHGAEAVIVGTPFEQEDESGQWTGEWSVRVQSNVYGDAEIKFSYQPYQPEAAPPPEPDVEDCPPVITDPVVVEWGEITETVVEKVWGDTEVKWDENDKEWKGGPVLIKETVFGRRPCCEDTPLNGALIHWTIETTPQDCVEIIDSDCRGNISPDGRSVESISGTNDPVVRDSSEVPMGDGTSWIEVYARCEGVTHITLEVRYPYEESCPPVVIEELTINWHTVQLEKVPQVRWAGEKIVLEKRFGPAHAGRFVQFLLEGESPGALESINGLSTRDMVATWVDEEGIARAILTSEKPGECDVSVALYDQFYPTLGPPCLADLLEQLELDPAKLINQHGFVVFFLKLESVGLGIVDGERDGHDAGNWIPANPWDASADLDWKKLNVSQDGLLRMRVKGWFMGDDLSTRPEATLDYDGDGVGDIILPAGRWVLPNDWPKLAGPKWEDRRPHWDIMAAPWDGVTAPYELGDYDGDVCVPGGVAESPVIGPFSSLDDYSGEPVVPADSTVSGDLRTTVVPNCELDWWDCPMPPAKVIFEIEDGPGYLKQADKGEIYYTAGAYYTNPFYAVEIPASDLIPPVVNNGGYDWDSWGEIGDPFGPYDFWTIFNRPDPADDPDHPSRVEVYSDNHGEAMVYVNGDWGLDLSGWQSWTSGDVIDLTELTATVDYPYLRKHQPVLSSPVTAKWTWGKEVKVHVQQMQKPGDGELDIMRKLVTAYLCDRDGNPIVDERVEWTIDGPSGIIESLLPDTDGEITSPTKRSAVSFSRLPTAEEAAKYEEVFGEPCHHGIVGAVIFDSLRTTVDLHMAFYEEEGILFRALTLNFGAMDTDDPIEELYAGFNLVTYQGSTMSVAEAVAAIPSALLVTVWHFDNANKEWEVYVPDAPPYASDLEQMAYLQPYAIVVTTDFTWVY